MRNKIAVIMSVYKSDNPMHFHEAVHSILSQTINCDLFIYKDGTLPDNIIGVLDSIKNNDNIHIYGSEKNHGLAFSLNYLIDIISQKNSYQFIARMDSDDIAINERLEFQSKFLESHPDIHVLGTYCSEFGELFSLEEKKLPVYHIDILNFSIYRCPLVHPSVMFRSEIFKLSYRYPEDTTLTEDMAFWFLLLDSGFKFHNLPKNLLRYRLNNLTLLRRRGFSKAISEIKTRFFYMHKLKKTSAKNIFLILSRLPFHLLPNFALKFIYKYLR